MRNCPNKNGGISTDPPAPSPVGGQVWRNRKKIIRAHPRHPWLKSLKRAYIEKMLFLYGIEDFSQLYYIDSWPQLSMWISMRVLLSGKAPAFQAGITGPIPVTRYPLNDYIICHPKYHHEKAIRWYNKQSWTALILTGRRFLRREWSHSWGLWASILPGRQCLAMPKT